jgi:nucleoside-diphosphate-sugar epimerase
MKTMISGSKGFIGSHLSKRLSDLGHQVIPITQEHLYEPLKLKQIFEKEKPDYIFHLASYGNMANQKDVPMTIFANLIGTFNMLSASAQIPYKKFVSFSTSSVNLPTETYYSASKAGAERLCKAFIDQKKKPILIVRPYSVYGEGEADFRFIPTVCRALVLGEEMSIDPDPVHDWVYVEDFLDILIDNLDSEESLLEIGTGIATSNREMVMKLVSISGRPIKTKTVNSLRSYDNEHWVCPVTHKTKHSLDVGLLNTFKYYDRLLRN